MPPWRAISLLDAIVPRQNQGGNAGILKVRCNTARKILEILFGQPFRIAGNPIDDVLAEAKRTQNGFRMLPDLVVKMQNCGAGLNHVR